MIDVLVVDDDVTVARIHAGFVAAEPGFRVCAVAHTASAALDALERHGPELVLLDIHLPDGSGLDLLTRMRAVRPQLDAIVITAAREHRTVAQALRVGAAGYLMKPFPREDLSARLSAYRAHLHGADEGGVADQAAADRLFGAPPARGASARGVAETTLRAVRDALAASPEDLSAQETAERVGVSRVSARRYLEHLHDRGEVRVQLRYGAGRPERRYRLVR
ncbi:response regulator [Microbacterium betulae]|uniref:Transcriptional regulatory protein n=1 Tax=Microbacterium betulae TaxID=2981139 RepID=A0AA97FIJ9_9MICO|nr:response regulator [Microbacterium sp. AB]WOF23578.1 response regulator [Microbacterium sp. AB]